MTKDACLSRPNAETAMLLLDYHQLGALRDLGNRPEVLPRCIEGVLRRTDTATEWLF